MTITELHDKARWIWRQTLLLHKRAPETRIASSLSPLEIFTVLYYLPVLRFKPDERFWAGRDRFIVSKGHGSISLYPILADLGFFDMAALETICQPGSFLGGIPDPVIPGYETVNGSLGHGLGVGCGMAMALRQDAPALNAIVLTGDAELHEGSVWEAIAFAGHHRLDNLLLITDNNRTGMLDRTANIIEVEPLVPRLSAFGWDVAECDGHDLGRLCEVLPELANRRNGRPKALIAQTIKGHGVPELENSSLAHILTVKPEVIDELIRT